MRPAKLNHAELSLDDSQATDWKVERLHRKYYGSLDDNRLAFSSLFVSLSSPFPSESCYHALLDEHITEI